MKMQTYSKSLISIISIVIFLGASVQFVHSDTRNGNIGIYLLIDRSLSMEQEISSVKDYLQQTLCNNILQSDDFVYAMAFFGETQQLFKGHIGKDFSIEELKDKFAALEADRHYTDIGSALDMLDRDIEASAASPFSHTYILLLSDNIHEGPPDSPYPGKTRDLDHHLLVPRKEIPREGWKISILGITVEEKARRLATEITAAWNQRN